MIQWIVVSLLIGLIPGLLFFEWAASPFGMGIPLMNTNFARIFLTLSQFLRGRGVLVKRNTGRYEIGTFMPEENAVALSDGVLDVSDKDLRWRIFGKKPFAVTWEEGTDLHELAMGDDPHEINMAAIHRHLEGSNNDDAINRTEEHSKAEYGGGEQPISSKVMIGLIIFLMILGVLTAVLLV